MKNNLKSQHPESNPANRIDDFFVKMSSLLNGVRNYRGQDEADFKNSRLDQRYLLPEGTYLGRFRVGYPIGRGGMGVVYLGRDLRDGSDVAIKVLLGFQDNHSTRRRFLREIDYCQRLNHPNIIRVIDYGQQDGIMYCVMPFVDGFSLEKLIGHSDLTEVNDRQYGEPSAGALFSNHSGVGGEGFKKSNRQLHSHFSDLWDTEERISRIESNGKIKGSVSQNSNESVSTVPVLLNEFRSSAGSGAFHANGSPKQDSFWNWIATIGKQAADGLHYAHQHGVIHRDIKPSNLLVDSTGKHLLIADFGLAKIVGQDAMTATGDLLGTLQYMAPEALVDQADHQSDLYGLGLSLYELVSCEHPFQNQDRNQLIQDMLNQSPKRLSEIVPGIDADLESIIHRAIEKNPEDRYETAEQLSSDLNCFLNGRTISKKPKNYLKKIKRFTRRNRSLTNYLVCFAVIFVLLTVSTILSVYGLVAASNAKSLAQEQAKREYDIRQKLYLESMANQIESDLNDVKLRSLSNQIGDIRSENLKKLDQISETARDIDSPLRWKTTIRNLALATILKPDLSTVGQWEHPIQYPVQATSICFSKDQKRYFAAVDNKYLEESVQYGLFEVQGGQSYLVKSFDLPGRPTFDSKSLVMFPDGKTVLVKNIVTKQIDRIRKTVENFLYLLDLETGKYKKIPTDGSVGGFDVSPDFREVAVAADGKLTFYRLDDLENSRVWKGFTPDENTCVSYSNDGDKIAVSLEGEIFGRNLSMLHQPLFVFRVKGNVKEITWRDDDMQVAAGFRGRVRTFDLSTGRPHQQLPIKHFFVSKIYYCNGGVHTLSIGQEGGTLLSCPEGRKRVTRLPEVICDMSADRKFGVFKKDFNFYRKRIRPSHCLKTIRSPGVEAVRKVIGLPKTSLFWIHDANSLHLYDHQKDLIIDNYGRIKVTFCLLDERTKNFFFTTQSKLYRQPITEKGKTVHLGSPILLADFSGTTIEDLRFDKDGNLVALTDRLVKYLHTKLDLERYVFQKEKTWRLKSREDFKADEAFLKQKADFEVVPPPLKVSDISENLYVDLCNHRNGVSFFQHVTGETPLTLYLDSEDPVQKVMGLFGKRWLYVRLTNFRFVMIDLYKAKQFLLSQGMDWPKELREIGLKSTLLDYQFETTRLPEINKPELKVRPDKIRMIPLRPSIKRKR